MGIRVHGVPLEAEVSVYVGAMGRLVAASAPTGTTLQPAGVVFATDDNLPFARDLEVTAQAEVVVPRDEHLVVNRAVRVVADGAAFTQRIVGKDERTLLLRVTLRARLLGRRKIDA